MLGGIPIVRILGMAAGLLILFIGVFVLRAKPDSRLHQLFFALAAADGVSTFAFNLALSPVIEPVRLHAFLVYYYAFVAFLGLLIAFGMNFPRPLLRRASSRAASIALASVVGALLVIHGLRHSIFWTAFRSNRSLGFALEPAGRVVATFFVIATAFIIARGALLIRHESSSSHRFQGALVLGGMALGYAPFPTTNVIVAFRDGASSTFFSSAWDVAVSYWASLLTLLCILWATAIILVEGRADRRTERNIALACLAGVLLLTLVALRDSSRETASSLRTLALLVYPIFLGYAIARYDVLDIDAQVRRAATASLLGAGFTAAFLLFEVFLEQMLQRVLSVGVSATLVAGLAAALLTAIISIPLARLLRRAATRVVPTLGHTDIDTRKREIYKHALHGAAMDGVIAPHEMRVLQRLRESLQISDTEHSAMLREVGAAV